MILKNFLDNARPPEPRIQNTRRTLGRLQLHELQTCIESQVQTCIESQVQTCIESQVQSFIIQHQHCDHCRRHISTYIQINTISRKALYSVPSSSQYGYDLDILERRVWPLIRYTYILINLVSGEYFHLFAASSVIHCQLCRGRSLIHDSYRCASSGGLSP